MDDEIDLRKYIRVILRQWKIIVGLALLTALLGGGVTFMQPPVYEATALVSVVSPSFVLRLASGEKSPTLQYRAYPDLAVSDQVLKDMISPVGSLIANVTTIEKLRGYLKASSGVDFSLLELSVRYKDPQVAAQVANLWAQAMVTHASKIYGQDAANLVDYQQQLTEAKTALDNADAALAAFQSGNQGPVLTAQQDNKTAMLTDYLNRQHNFTLALQSAQSLLLRLKTLDPATQATLSDELAIVSLSTQAWGSTTVPLQFQISPGASLSGKTVREQIMLVQDLLATLQANVEDAKTQVASLEPEILQVQGKLAEAKTHETQLGRERDLASARYLALSAKVQDAQIAQEETANTFQIASDASVPTGKKNFGWPLGAALGGVLGVMIGFLIVLVREWWHEPEVNVRVAEPEARPLLAGEAVARRNAQPLAEAPDSLRPTP
jgi:uncharacterized protein involved in exopolysaccharide biosynthesis